MAGQQWYSAPTVFGEISLLLRVLTVRQRWRWAVVIPLIVACAGVEMVAAAGVFGLILMLTEPDRAALTPGLSVLLRDQEGPGMVMAFMILFTVFFIVKNLFLMLAGHLIARLTQRTIAELASELFEGYLNAPYAHHLRRGSTELIHTSTQALDSVFRLAAQSAVTVAAEVLIVCGVVVVLMWAAPGVTLIAVGALFILLGVLLRMTSRWFHRLGTRAEELSRESLKTLQQTLGGIKEVLVMGRAAYWGRVFADQQHALARTRWHHATLDNIPRLLVETLFAAAALLLVVLASASGSDSLPLLGLFAYAGFRIIPSFNRITTGMNTIAQGRAFIAPVHEDLQHHRAAARQAAAQPVGRPVAFTDRLVLDGVTLTYEGASTTALSDLSLTIRRGESVGIAGATGAGKSTFVGVLLGLLTPSEGNVSVDGVDVSENLAGWRRKIGFVPQEVFLADDSLRRNIAFGCTDGEIDDARIRRAVRSAQLEPLVNGLPRGLETSVGERGVRLSGGERQRVAIARALYREPELLVFDEATASLDQQTETELKEAIGSLRGERTLIVVAHRSSMLRLCDRLVLLERGRVVADGPFDELLAGSAEFRALAGIRE